MLGGVAMVKMQDKHLAGKAGKAMMVGKQAITLTLGRHSEEVSEWQCRWAWRRSEYGCYGVVSWVLRYKVLYSE